MKSKRFLANPGLRIASLVIAFAVWLVIMNVSDPVKTKTFAGIPVNVTNASYLEGQGLSYKLANGAQTISVTVNANRNLLERLTSSGIVVTADLTQIIDFNSEPVMVPVTVSVPGVSQDSITAVPRNIEITLEDLISKEFVINTSAGDTAPARGYEIGSTSASPEKLTLRGPKSLVEKIDKVVANVDVTNLRKDAEVGAAVRIYDKNGDMLDDSQMKYLTPATPYENIEVFVKLFKVLADVPITAETYGTPGRGYTVGEISVTPSTISLVGDEDTLAVFRRSGGKIVISEASHAVDISGAVSDQDINVKITDYIPGDMRLAEDLSDKVVVSVKILEQDSESFNIETKTVRQENLSAGMDAVFKESTLDIRVKADKDLLDRLSVDDIRASVDFKGVEAGDVTLPVKVELPEGYTLASEVSADITISVQQVTETGEDGDTAREIR